MVKVKANDTFSDDRVLNTKTNEHGLLHVGQIGEASTVAAKELQDLGFVKIIDDTDGKKDTASEKKHIEHAPENKMRKITKSTKSKKE